MIESYGFVEMFLLVPMKLWESVKARVFGVSVVAVLMGGCA